MNLIKLAICCTVMLWSTAYSAQESDYLEFFNKYQSLGNNFDTAVIELYSDDAKIIAVRSMPDGIEQTLKVEGKKWKQMIAGSMEIGKQRGDKSKFSNIKVFVEKESAKITATRYATIKCFNDNRYYMIVRGDDNGELKIIEEFMESPIQSKCENIPKQDLSLVLQGSTSLLNKQLPIMVDSDTKLEKTSSEGNTLIYHYVLVNYRSNEIDASILEKNIKPMAIQQTCTLPNMKPVLDQGGTISYRYNGRDQQQILVINIDKNTCL